MEKANVSVRFVYAPFYVKNMFSKSETNVINQPEMTCAAVQ